MDIRQLILDQLLFILGTLTDIVTVVHNRGLLEQDARPAAALMDGDETARLTGDKRGRVRMSPELITMKPQLFIVLKSSKPQSPLVGEDLNRYRVALIRAIDLDTNLLALIGSNGNIAYTGCTTDLKSGQQAEGQMRLDFDITYVLDPSNL